MLAATTVLASFGTVRADEPEEGLGAMFRGGVIGGQGVPQVRPLAPLELFPYFLYDDSLYFSDLRFFPTIDGTFGGNAGFGYRYYDSDWDRVFGASFWYDADNTRNVYFQQLGLSLESYAGQFDVRANFYLPVGQTEQQAGLSYLPGTAQFVGQNVMYSQMRSWYAAMKGLDAEAGVPIPGEFSEEHGLRVYGGGYHYRDDSGNTITGGTARVVANVIDGLDAQVQVTHDSFFDTRVFVGASWTFGALHRSQMDQSTAYGRLGEHVTRNYTVLAPIRKEVEQRTAIDPSTGAPYTFAHVSSSAAAGGTGSVLNPYQTIAQAQAAGKDIVFVHAGSVFSGADAAIALNPGDRIFGDSAAAQYFLPVRELGTLRLPHGPMLGNRPLLSGAPGDSVLLASNAQFAGFTISGAGGAGILGTGVSNAYVSNVGVDAAAGDGVRMVNAGTGNQFNSIVVANAGASGISLVNSLGDVTFTNAIVQDTTGYGINIDAGTGTTRFLGTTNVASAGGPAVSIRNLASTGKVGFVDLAIANRQDRGFEIANSAGSVSVAGIAAISNGAGSTASALAISNTSGNHSFNKIDITGATGAPAVSLQNGTGTTSFGTLNIAAQNGTALFADTAGYLVVNAADLNGNVDMSKGGAISATNGTAVDIFNTGLNVNLKSISSSNATYGVKLVNTSGTFGVYGAGAPGTGGTIQGATTAIFVQNAGISGFQWMVLDSNATGIRADNVTYLGFHNGRISNSAAYGIDTLNATTVAVTNSILGGNASGDIRGLFDQVRSYAYTISNTTLISTTADNVVLQLLAGGAGSTMNLFGQDLTVNNSFAGASGIKVDWNGVLSAAVDQSAFTMAGGSNTGVRISNASTSALTTISLTDTGFWGTAAGGSTALYATAAGSAQVNLTKNMVQFDAPSGTGFRMALGQSSTVLIADNGIFDTTDGATGILFDSMKGPGTVTIQNNIIGLTSTGGLLDRGIVFSAIDDTSGKIHLLSPINNFVYNADTPFFAPVGTTTGSILVNGQPEP